MLKNPCKSTNLLLFVKYPDRGKVKSRLSKIFGEERVLRLYEGFVFDLLETLMKGGCRPTICFHPPSAREKISLWLGEGYVYKPQNGRDLGEKMKKAFVSAFSDEYEKVVLIGSDIPDLTQEIMDEAFASDGDAVIGPSMDGGYYLIGFRREAFLPSVFDGIAWSTASVFERTMEIFRKHSYKVHILPQLRDIDTPEDLRAFCERNRDTAFAHSRTMTLMAGELKSFMQDTSELSG